MELRANLYSEKHFRRYLTKFLHIKNFQEEKQRDDAFDKYVAHWARWEEWFRFLQALGPAVGFILTVSSLIEALQPSTRAGNDLGGFLTGIHIAMISTFLGLLLRIVALEASRINGVLLRKVDMQLLITKGEAHKRRQSDEHGREE
jgi:biopolymer transport protein ExbB/TolQ